MSPETTEQENHKYLETISETGLLTLASRFKRLTDLLFSQVQDLFNERGLKFKSTWFAFLLTLRHNNSVDIKSLAQRRRISHSAASQIIKEMEKQGFVSSKVKTADQRQKVITITEKGEEMLNKLIPQLKIVEASLHDILGSQFEVLFQALDNIEYELNEKPFKKRRLAKVEDIEVVEYNPSHREAFEHLLRSWLEIYFTIEERDLDLFKDPQQAIVSKGGQIFMALHQGKAVGTVCLSHHSDKTAEISKIGVDDTLQGRGIGDKLLSKAIETAKNKKYQEIMIETDTELKVSMSLFRKHGFRDDPRKEHFYDHRGNIWLKKALGQ